VFEAAVECHSLSSSILGPGGVELTVDLAGEVALEAALEAAADLSWRSTLGGPSLDVGAGVRVHPHASHGGHVQGRGSAGIGFTSARLASAASERPRPGCDHAANATAAVTGPMLG